MRCARESVGLQLLRARRPDLQTGGGILQLLQAVRQHVLDCDQRIRGAVRERQVESLRRGLRSLQLEWRRPARSLQRSLALSVPSEALMAGGESLQVVQTEDGPVSVTSIEYLQQLAAVDERRASDLRSQVADKRGEVGALQARAGAELVAHEKDWTSADRAGRIEAARSLSQLVANLEQRSADVKGRPHHGLGGIVDRVKDSHELDGLQHQLQSARAELDNRYRAVVDHLAAPT